MKPTISVLGLLPAQAHVIEKAYKNRARLRFWDGGDPIATLKAMANNSDVMMMRTKHCSHRTHELLKSFGAQITMVNGGLNSLQESIEEYLNGNNARGKSKDKG